MTETSEPQAAKNRLPRKQSKCSIEGCKRPYRAKGYCNVHYRHWRHGEIEGHRARYKTCGKEGCLKPVAAHGLCQEHGQTKGGEAATPAAAS